MWLRMSEKMDGFMVRSHRGPRVPVRSTLKASDTKVLLFLLLSSCHRPSSVLPLSRLCYRSPAGLAPAQSCRLISTELNGLKMKITAQDMKGDAIRGSRRGPA